MASQSKTRKSVAEYGNIMKLRRPNNKIGTGEIRIAPMIFIGGATRAESTAKTIAMTVIVSIARRVRAWRTAPGPFGVHWPQQTFTLGINIAEQLD